MTTHPIAVRDSVNFPKSMAEPVVTIGNFDGVHLGHQALLSAARELAGERPVCAYTFDPSPRDVMVPGHGVPYIQSVADRVRSLGDNGADVVVLETFTKAYSQTTAESYARDILLGRMGASGVVVGWDFRFGQGRAGDVELLRSLLDVPVVQVSPVDLDGEPVSSTRVRAAVLDGRVQEAARLLTRPHRVRGAVVRGDARGRTIGFPTANVAPTSQLLPSPGVYAVRMDVGDGVWRGGVANLGVRPTFEPGRGALEVHLFEFSDDLYDASVQVGFVGRIREERRFEGLDALVDQIKHDADQARTLLGD